MKTETQWYLYNLESHKLHGPLLKHEVRAVLASIKIPARAAWAIRSEQQDWSSLKDVDASTFGHSFASTANAPEPESKGGEGLKDTGTSTGERRKQERFPMRLQVIVSREDKCFRTHTTDVSLGGIGLEDRVPSYLIGAACEIYLSRPKERDHILFHGVLAGDKGDPKRFSFVTPPPNILKRLRLSISE